MAVRGVLHFDLYRALLDYPTGSGRGHLQTKSSTAVLRARQRKHTEEEPPFLMPKIGLGDKGSRHTGPMRGNGWFCERRNRAGSMKSQGET